MQNKIELCELCGDPLPEFETMFKYHGYSGPCPRPPLPKKEKPTYEQLESQLTAVKDQIKNAVGVLEFYAEKEYGKVVPDDWRYSKMGGPPDTDQLEDDSDGGEKARQFLASIKESGVL